MSVSNRERFLRQVHEMHRLWNQSTADLTVEQMNYRERDGVLPIAFTVLHYVRGEDRLICAAVLNEPTLWEAGGWQERIGGQSARYPARVEDRGSRNSQHRQLGHLE